MTASPSDCRTRIGSRFAFARVLRGAGLAVPTGSTVVFARALAAVGVDRPSGVYWAGRASLVRRPEDVAAYDQAFETFFGGTEAGSACRRRDR